MNEKEKGGVKLLIIGSIGIDSVKTPFGENPNVLGGSASYAATSASYFTDVKIISIVGDDFPKKYLTLFRNRRIDTSGIEAVKGGRTFRWKGVYGWDLGSVNTISTHLNVLADFNPRLSEADKKCKIVFLANNDPDVQINIIRQLSPNKLIAADTIEFWIKNKKEKLLKVLKAVDIFIVNEKEARLLTKQVNLIKAAKDMISYGVKKVIIKKGEHGLLYLACPAGLRQAKAGVAKNKFFICPAYPLETVYDPTGAGDSFAGGFLGFLASAKHINDASLRKALIYGTIMASYNVEGFDLKVLSRLNKYLIEKRYKEFIKLVKF